jgi:hypothetical protein
MDAMLICFSFVFDRWMTTPTRGADGWFRCDRLHRPGFPTFLRDVLYRFGYTGIPTYCGRL